jgi:DNA-binding MarR family transcriptional regulator
LSKDFAETPKVRASPAAHRGLVAATIELGIEVDAVGQAAAAHIGINQTDLICLGTLFNEGPMSAGRIAAAVGLTSGATTTAIDRLERAGYVHRRVDPTDRRRVLVVASEEGARRAFALFDDLLVALADLADSYSDKQLTLLLDFLGRVRDLLSGHAAELRGRAANPAKARDDEDKR